MTIGRPHGYSESIADAICSRLMAGESLTAICRDEGLPAYRTVFDWISDIPEFAHKYARAREIQHDALAESVIDIADADPATFIREQGKGDDKREIICVDGAAVAHQKNRIEARKWWVSKVAAKKYGDRVHTEHSGAIGVHEMVNDILDRKATLPVTDK